MNRNPLISKETAITINNHIADFDNHNPIHNIKLIMQILAITIQNCIIDFSENSTKHIPLSDLNKITVKINSITDIMTGITAIKKLKNLISLHMDFITTSSINKVLIINKIF